MRRLKFISALLWLVAFLCRLSPVQARTVCSWGEQRFDGRDFIGAEFQAIAAGGDHSLALKSDGSIVGWGNDRYGQATPPDGNDYVAIAAGEDHSLVLKSDGSIVGWGGRYGQATPPDGNDYVAIAAGGHHSLALKSDGSIVGWGYDGHCFENLAAVRTHRPKTDRWRSGKMKPCRPDMKLPWDAPGFYPCKSPSSDNPLGDRSYAD